jgi:integrase
LLAACSPHLRSIVECALETGMRRGEILSLQWRQVEGMQRYRHGPPHGFAPTATDEHCSDVEHTGRPIMSVMALYRASSAERS